MKLSDKVILLVDFNSGYLESKTNILDLPELKVVKAEDVAEFIYEWENKIATCIFNAKAMNNVELVELFTGMKYKLKELSGDFLQYLKKEHSDKEAQE